MSSPTHVSSHLSPTASPDAEHLSLSIGHNSNVVLSGSQKKTAKCVEWNVAEMIKEAGEKCVGFTTLTVGDFSGKNFVPLVDYAEANRRFNSLNTGFLKRIFEKFVVVVEETKKKGVHFHLIGVVSGRKDIRSGCDFAAFKRRDYSSAPSGLREIWSEMRATLPGYGFGRAETLPIKTSGGAVACYASKYIEKNILSRPESSVGKKLVRYVGFSSHVKPNDFGWNTPGARQWRADARALSRLIGAESPEEIADALGPRWAMKLTRVGGIVDCTTWNYAERETVRKILSRDARAVFLRRKSVENLRSFKGCDFQRDG